MVDMGAFLSYIVSEADHMPMRITCSRIQLYEYEFYLYLCIYNVITCEGTLLELT